MSKQQYGSSDKLGKSNQGVTHFIKYSVTIDIAIVERAITIGEAIQKRSHKPVYIK